MKFPVIRKNWYEGTTPSDCRLPGYGKAPVEAPVSQSPKDKDMCLVMVGQSGLNQDMLCGVLFNYTSCRRDEED